MKAIITLIFALLFGVLVIAQDKAESAVVFKSEKDTLTCVANNKIIFKEATVSGDSVARLYRFRHSRIYKELSFATSTDKPKLA
jgi:hypothetical protein